jgi:hypothetical protein
MLFCEKQSKEQKQYLKLCAQVGHPEGLWSYVLLFCQGDEQKRNLIFAANTGEYQFCKKLAFYFKKGKNGFPIDLQKVSSYERLTNEHFQSNISHFV